jgi:hypothetical protein
MPDMSKLKYLGEIYCTQYATNAKFYADEAHASGQRHLVVVYEKGQPKFMAAIPDDWDEQAVQNFIFWPMKPGAPYPAWEVPARTYGSDTLFLWWKGEKPI